MPIALDQVCRVCGCTESDCSGCIERTGRPCHWIEPDLCSSCHNRNETPAIMPALTVWQPWATLIAEGLKRYEFRGWIAPAAMIGRRVAIHAGARPVRKDEVRQLLLQLQGSYWRQTGLIREPCIELLTRVLMMPKSLPLSSVLCTARLGEPIRDDLLAAQLGIPAIHDSDRGQHSNYGWPLTDVIKLEPFIPARGAQGFWTWQTPVQR